MLPRFCTRRAIQLALAANALRPLRSTLGSVPSFFSGWLTTELAPQFLALTAADTALHVARNGIRSRSSQVGIGLAALSAAGLGSLISSANRARNEVESALLDALGPDYHADLEESDESNNRMIPLSQLALPFRMHNTDITRQRDIAYAPGGKRFLLDIYQPRDNATARPVLLQVHGGAWMIGNKDQQGIPLMRHMAQRGWICVAINYPLSPAKRWPEHIVAAKRAVGWIRENIADYGGDPSFLAVTGGSAGGHLAALLALTANDPRLQPDFPDVDTSVQACAPHYGVYDFAASSGSRASTVRRDGVIARYVVGKDPSQYLDDYLRASPIDRIGEDAPPFFVIHGDHDTIVPVREAREFSTKLRKVARNPVAYAELAGAQHAFDVFPSIRSAHVVAGVQRFLEWSYHETKRESSG